MIDDEREIPGEIFGLCKVGDAVYVRMHSFRRRLSMNRIGSEGASALSTCLSSLTGLQQLK